MRNHVRFVVLLLVGLLAGCSKQSAEKSITLATTTSTQDSGLLDVLLPAFEEEMGIKVKVVAVGSGQALELGRRGDADVLLTHAPAAEESFMDDGWGDERLSVMHNDFVIVGPAADSGNIKSTRTANDALKKIAAAENSFVSRGDDSGTHQKEQALWEEAGIKPEGPWYIKAGAGMAQALRMADEKGAYTLSDRATYLALRQELKLVVLVEGDERLLNRYSVITLDSSTRSDGAQAGGKRFADFLVSKKGQEIIGEFGKERFGQQLFVPDAAGGK